MEKFRDRQFHGEMRSVPLPFNGKLSIKWLKLNFSVQITLCLKIAKIPCTVLVRNSLEIESINFYNKDGKTKVWRRKGRTLDLYINILLILISGDLYSNIILIIFFVKLLGKTAIILGPLVQLQNSIFWKQQHCAFQWY